MQKRGKRLVCLLLAFVLCAGLLGMGQSAEAAGLETPMNAEMYALLDDIVQAVYYWEPEVDLSPYDLSDVQVRRVLDEFFFTYPRFFYYIDYNDTIWNNTLHLYYSCDTLAFRKDDVPIYEAAVQKALDTAVKPGMNTLGIMLALHDYLCATVEYDDPVAELSGLYSAHTAYGALVEGRAVCQGYAMAYVDLLQRCGIECRYERSNDMNHGWTLVKLGGLWYHIDVTWDDDKTPQPKHQYFLNSDYQLSADHYGWMQYEYCISREFDDSDVQKMTGPYFFTSGTESYSFLFNAAVPGFDLMRWDWDSNTLYRVKTIEDTWPYPGSPGYYYADCFSNIIMRDGLLYFNGPETLYRYDPATDVLTSQGVSTDGNGYLYGLFWYGDQVYCYVGFDASMDEEDMLIMHIPDDFFGSTHTHRLTRYPYVAPTCVEDGHVDYWYCSECGNFYFDSACTRMIVDDSWCLPATGHQLTAHPYVAPTAVKSGSSAYWSCSGCGKFFSDAACTHEIAADSWILPALGGGLCGDVNSDGTVNAKDGIVLARYIAGWSGYVSMADLSAADVNSDGAVNAKDGIILARHIAGWTGYDNLPFAG